jgi:hypothetical protein
MLATTPIQRQTRALEFGIYRDGDNNLDAVQAATLSQAEQTSLRDRSIEFTVEDTTARRGFLPARALRTETYTIADGGISSNVHVSSPHDMADRSNLAAFVARTLDNAERSGAKATWLDLIDHGGGDGGGLEADHGSGIMPADDIAGAISDGVAQHAREHPEDAGRTVDGVVANQCLMATESFSSSLSHAGVRYLAASPETMLAPGVPTTVATDIAHHLDDPVAMAQAVVRRTMTTRYEGGGLTFGPAAAFDVIDLDPKKIASMTSAVAGVDRAIAKEAHHRNFRAAIREDARTVDGMVRFTHENMPWRADRPAIALYDTLASDGRLPDALRAAAANASTAVGATVLAHRESGEFAPFGGADYSDAAGPTVHFPLTGRQIDAWAPEIRETDNAFFKAVGADAVSRALA